MRVLTIDEWRKEGTDKFGDRWSLWKFQCVKCGNIQCGKDFESIGLTPEEIEKVVFFSCIGRWKKDVGCDWTLGGLFRIHKLEVTNAEGVPIPAFEFAVCP